MNIIVNIDKNKTENVQPKIYDIGTVTSTLQNLLDNTSIIISNYRPIVLKFIDLNGNVQKAFLDLKDYNQGSQYGLGKNITVNDLILISSNTSNTSDAKVYYFLLTIISGSADVIELKNDLTNPVTVTRVGNGYIKVRSVGAFASEKFSITSGFSYATEYSAIYDEYDNDELYINISNARDLGTGDDGPIVRLPIKIEIFE